MACVTFYESCVIDLDGNHFENDSNLRDLNENFQSYGD